MSATYMSPTERELYEDRNKKSAVSRMVDRAVLGFLGIILVVLIAYIAYFQLQYQQQSREITKARNDQLAKILTSNEQTKAYIRCAVASREASNSSDLAVLDKCVEDTAKVMEANQ